MTSFVICHLPRNCIIVLRIYINICGWMLFYSVLKIPNIMCHSPGNLYVWHVKTLRPKLNGWPIADIEMHPLEWKIQYSNFNEVYLSGRKWQFPHLAITVSPRLEVESSGHAWLEGCNFQRKRPLAPTGYRHRHPADENIDEYYMNSCIVTTFYFFCKSILISTVFW